MANFPRDIFRASRSGSQTLALRMAPLIDVIFLLLIFFLVAANWNKQEKVLPLNIESANAAAIQPGIIEPLILHITEQSDACFVRTDTEELTCLRQENIEADLEQLVANMAGYLNATKRTSADPVEIVCGPNVSWENIAKIYNVLYGSGLVNITFQLTE